MNIAFDNSYARLPGRFFAATRPLQSPSPKLIRINEQLTAELGIDSAWLKSTSGLDMLSGRALPEGAEPIARAYAGHQLATSCRSLGMDAPSSLAKWWIDKAVVVTSS